MLFRKKTNSKSKTKAKDNKSITITTNSGTKVTFTQSNPLPKESAFLKPPQQYVQVGPTALCVQPVVVIHQNISIWERIKMFSSSSGKKKAQEGGEERRVGTKVISTGNVKSECNNENQEQQHQQQQTSALAKTAKKLLKEKPATVLKKEMRLKQPAAQRGIPSSWKNCLRGCFGQKFPKPETNPANPEAENTEAAGLPGSAPKPIMRPRVNSFGPSPADGTTTIQTRAINNRAEEQISKSPAELYSGNEGKDAECSCCTSENQLDGNIAIPEEDVHHLRTNSMSSLVEITYRSPFGDFCDAYLRENTHVGVRTGPDGEQQFLLLNDGESLKGEVDSLDLKEWVDPLPLPPSGIPVRKGLGQNASSSSSEVESHGDASPTLRLSHRQSNPSTNPGEQQNISANLEDAMSSSISKTESISLISNALSPPEFGALNTGSFDHIERYLNSPSRTTTPSTAPSLHGEAKSPTEESKIAVNEGAVHKAQSVNSFVIERGHLSDIQSDSSSVTIRALPINIKVPARSAEKSNTNNTPQSPSESFDSEDFGTVHGLPSSVLSEPYITEHSPPPTHQSLSCKVFQPPPAAGFESSTSTTISGSLGSAEGFDMVSSTETLQNTRQMRREQSFKYEMPGRYPSTSSTGSSIRSKRMYYCQ